MTRSHAIRIAAAILALILALAAGLVVPMIVRAHHVANDLPHNDWLGLRADPAPGVLARCALGTARSVDGGTSVWAAVAGEQALDIIQVGARITPDGRRRFFAAWGRGVPNGVGSLYEERDLGATDRNAHKYTVQLINGAWSLSIDGSTRLRVPDTFRTWPMRSSQVQHETESAADPFGGTRANPVKCSRARTYSGAWVLPAWSMVGYGAKAAAAQSAFGRDWFAVWR